MSKSINAPFKFEKLAKDILKKRNSLDGLNIRKCAEQAKINYVTFQRLEAGQQSPAVENLVLICNWLQVPVQTYF